MRVAVVTTSWPRFDGDPSGHFVQAEARALARCGDDVVVLSPGAHAAAFGWPGFAARVKEAPLRLAGAAAWVARTREAVEQGGFDRVVAHWAVPSAWPIAMGEGPSLEVVSHGGDVRLLTRLPTPVRARLVGRIARRAERWRFVSKALLGSLVATLPRDVASLVEAKAEVRPCVIEVATPAAEDIEAKRARVGAPFAVSVGRLVATKRVDVAIAWAASRGVPLVVVGDGPARASLERRASAEGGRVLFAGRTTRDEALAWIAAASELVQASRDEGFSTVEREARALGVSVTCL